MLARTLAFATFVAALTFTGAAHACYAPPPPPTEAQKAEMQAQLDRQDTAFVGELARRPRGGWQANLVRPLRGQPPASIDVELSSCVFFTSINPGDQVVVFASKDGQGRWQYWSVLPANEANLKAALNPTNRLHPRN